MMRATDTRRINNRRNSTILNPIIEEIEEPTVQEALKKNNYWN